MFWETIFPMFGGFFFCMKPKQCWFLPVVCGYYTKHRWVIPTFFWQLRWWLHGGGGSEGNTQAYETKNTAAQPSSAVSLCGDCTGNPAEIKWMQAYTQTNSHIHTHTHTNTACLDKPISTYCFWLRRTILNAHAYTQLATCTSRCTRTYWSL